MFSAFKAAVSSGITANYSVSKNAQFRAGPWSVYQGKRKATNESVSVFVFDKKALSSYLTRSGISKSLADDVYDRLRREVNALAKIRHPSIVRIIEPLEDGRAAMTFVTEPLSSCLKTLIDLQSSGSSREGDLDELVIQKGLLQITEGLLFLHNTAGQVHLDIQPSSILIDSKGDWKLGGLGFIQNFKDMGSSDYFIPQYDPRLPQFVQPNLDFSAPELILDRRLDPSNDVFSLGCLIVSIYTLQPPMQTNNNSTSYKSELVNIQRALKSKKIPGYLSTGTLPRLVTRSPMERISLEELKRSDFFDNALIRTINFLDDFPAKLVSEKKTFLSGLKQMLPQFPKSVLQRKILQSLLEELGKDESLVYMIMQNVFSIGQDMSQLGFSEKILPHLDTVKDQYGCQQAVLDFLPVLLSRLNTAEFKQHITPIFLKMLETAPPETQAQALTKTGDIMEKLDFITLKNELFPQIASVFGKTTSLSVKLEALRAFRVLIGSPGKTNGGLDKYSITEKLIPLLGGMKTREPKIIMTGLEVYSAIVDMVDIDVLSKSIVPHLLTLSMEALLTKTQFHAFITKIKSVIDKIEQDHSKKLSSTAPDSMSQSRPQSPSHLQQSSIQSLSKTGSEDFESLIYGGSSSGTPGNSTNNNLDAALFASPSASRATISPAVSSSLSPSMNQSTSFSALTPTTAAAPISKPLEPLEPQRNSGSSIDWSKSQKSSIDWSRASSQKPPLAPRAPGFGSVGSANSMNSIPTLPKPQQQSPSLSQPQAQPQAQSQPQSQKSLNQYQSLL